MGPGWLIWAVIALAAVGVIGVFALGPLLLPKQTPTPTRLIAVAPETPTGTAAPTLAATAIPATPEPSPTPAVITHTVKAGETLGGIARFYGASIADVLTLNNLTNANVVTVGQNLLIPIPAFQSGGPTATPTPLPTLPAPAVGEPVDGHVFAAADVITLRWEAVTLPLPADAYQVIIEDVTCMCGRRLSYIVAEASFIVPADLAPTDSVPHLFNWSVVAVRSVPVDEGEEPVYTAAGPASGVRTFIWAP